MVTFRRMITFLLCLFVSAMTAWGASETAPRASATGTTAVAELQQTAEHRVGPADQSSTFGFFGTSPESPDGTKIAYARYSRQPKDGRDRVPGELWICDRNDPGNQRKLTDIGGVPPHNGVELCWISDDAIMIRDRPAEGSNAIRVIHSVTGEDVFQPVLEIGRAHV